MSIRPMFVAEMPLWTVILVPGPEAPPHYETDTICVFAPKPHKAVIRAMKEWQRRHPRQSVVYMRIGEIR